MATYALIREGRIDNVMEWDGEAPYAPEPGVTVAALADLPEGAWIGWTCDAAGVWHAPEEPA